MQDKPKHSKIGASSCERWWNCSGSVMLSEQIPPQPTSFYALQGTAAHELCEWHLNKQLRKVDYSWLDEVIQVEDDDFPAVSITVDEEMLEAVQVYLDVVYADIDLYGCRPDQLAVERGFHLQSVHEDAYGTSDTVLQVPMYKIIVYDFKYGAGVAVSAIENKQGLYYGLGALLSLDEDDLEDIVEIEIVIVQPRVQDGISRWTISTAEMLEFMADLKQAADRVDAVYRGEVDPMDALNAGDWCKFCKYKPECPEVRNHLNRTAAEVFALAPLDETPAQQQLPEITRMTPEQVAHIMNNAELLKDWCNSVIRYGHSLAERGVKIPGYKLAPRRANRKWTNEDDVVKAYEIELGDNLFDRKLKSPAKLEKLLGRERKDEIEELVTRPDNGNTLVPESDKREEALPEVIEVFQDLEI